MTAFSESADPHRQHERCVTIDLGSRSYPVILSDAWDSGQPQNLLQQHVKDRPVAIVSNDTVWPLYGETLLQAVKKAGPSHCSWHVLPDGENHKTPAQWLAILDHLANNGLTRDGVLLALGGGVVCDMTGFAAASWMRGIPFIQVPTTLLAQVDASVGGKTGINHLAGKNLIGAFHQPVAVLVNTRVLTTLPEREFRSGLAEAVKYGLIQSAPFVDWMLRNRRNLLHREPGVLNQLVQQCCQFKAHIVREDETEQGRRAVLNLGHTFGHAIENLGHYRTLLHGEAVAIGMVMAATLSEHLGLARPGLGKKVAGIMQALGLPSDFSSLPAGIDIEADEYTPEALIQRMRLDKKVSHGRHRLILLKELGQADMVDGVTEADLRTVLQAFCA